MEPISLITGALLAGATTAAKNTSEKAINDAYSGLKNLVIRLFQEKKEENGELILKRYEEKPETWKVQMEEMLQKNGASKNEVIIQAAQTLFDAIRKKEGNSSFNLQANNVQGSVQAVKIENLTQNFTTQGNRKNDE